MAKMTKSQALSRLAEKTGVSKKAAGQFVEELVKLAYKEAKNSFTIPGLGKLVLVDRKARMGRNPATGEADSDSRQARGEVPHREGSQGRNSRRQVIREEFSSSKSGCVTHSRLFLFRMDRLVGRFLREGREIGDAAARAASTMATTVP